MKTQFDRPGSISQSLNHPKQSMKVQHQRHDVAAEMTGISGDWRSTGFAG